MQVRNEALLALEQPVSIPMISNGARHSDEQPYGSMLAAVMRVKIEALLAIKQAVLLGGRDDQRLYSYPLLLSACECRLQFL